LAAPWAGRAWVLGGLRVAERRSRWHLTLDRWTSRLSLGEVCVSPGVLRFSQKVARLSPDRLTVIPNGIDLGPIDLALATPRPTIGVPEGVHLALSVGRLDAQKGVADLLEAAERVLARRSDWHLAIAGDGPERDHLLRWLKDRPNLNERVHWLGQRDDVAGLLRTADLLVLASRWEGMPNVVLEAMASRRAVVATRVEGTEDLVVPGQTGWLVPPRSPEALNQALLEAAAQPEQCRAFGDAGRRRVEEAFSLDRTIKAYERLWADVLGYKYKL
jgi:glycosyltransferase involved in cell wall biosynthesis